MTWHPPVPRWVSDAAGTPWTVQRAWPGTAPGSYSVEVRSPAAPGVVAGHVDGGVFEAVTVEDRRLPALAAEASKGELVVHRAHKRAVLRAPDSYIKVFRPGRAMTAAASHRIAAAALSAGGFDTPWLLSTGPDVLVFSRVAGRSLYELGQPAGGLTDAAYAAMWSRWSRAWTGTINAANNPAFHASLHQLPVRDAEMEAANLQRWVDHWLRHSEGVAEAAPARTALLARTRAVTDALLSGIPDGLCWAHGDLHDKQMLGTSNPVGEAAAGVGLLDFDESCRAEAALDLANLDVHLELRRRQNLLTRRRYAVAHSAVMSAAARLDVSPGRFAAYAAATRLRLACLYSFRPPWGAHATEYLVSEDHTARGAALPERTR